VMPGFLPVGFDSPKSGVPVAERAKAIAPILGLARAGQRIGRKCRRRKRGPRPKIATVERREARVPPPRDAGRLRVAGTSSAARRREIAARALALSRADTNRSKRAITPREEISARWT
jgi:hypothetical protein